MFSNKTREKELEGDLVVAKAACLAMELVLHSVINTMPDKTITVTRAHFNEVLHTGDRLAQKVNPDDSMTLYVIEHTAKTATPETVSFAA